MASALPTLRTGRVVNWNDARGFGFVVDDETGQQSFLHVSATRAGSPRPRDGARVSYQLARADDGRMRAADVLVSAPGERLLVTGRTRGILVAAVVAIAVIVALQWLIDSRGGNGAVVAVLVPMSLISFAAYAADKRRAQHGAWRIPEATLHVIDLLGGWPGGLIAQRALRHKTRKTTFQIVFWFTVIADVAAVALVGAWLSRT